jgi:hypothetical protein
VAEGAADLVAIFADHEYSFLCAYSQSGLQDVAGDRLASDRMQDLGQFGFESCALSGSQDHGG